MVIYDRMSNFRMVKFHIYTTNIFGLREDELLNIMISNSEKDLFVDRIL